MQLCNQDILNEPDERVDRGFMQDAYSQSGVNEKPESYLFNDVRMENE